MLPVSKYDCERAQELLLVNGNCEKSEVGVYVSVSESERGEVRDRIE